MELYPQRYGRVVDQLRQLATTAGSEQRRHVRIEVQAKIDVGTMRQGVLEERFTSLTKDISSAGVGLVQTMPLEPGTQMLLELPEGRGKNALLVGVVRYCRAMANGIFGLGVEFQAEADETLARDWSDSANAMIRRIQNSILS